MKKNTLITLGVILTLIGIIGFFNNPIFGIFQVDTAHNLIHLASGILAFVFSIPDERAAIYGKVLTVVYGLMFVVGIVTGDNAFGMPMNAADHVLHLILTAAFAYVGFVDVVRTHHSKPVHKV